MGLLGIAFATVSIFLLKISKCRFYVNKNNSYRNPTHLFYYITTCFYRITWICVWENAFNPTAIYKDGWRKSLLRMGQKKPP